MHAMPELVSNVWAGDAVTFEAPLGLIRLPSLWQYAAAIVAIFAALALSQLAPDNHSGLLEVFTAFGLILGVITLVTEVVGRMNRASARRLRVRPTPDLRALAERCWLRSFTVRVFRMRFDAREWIERTGSDGPRLLLRETKLPAFAADEAINEEESIDQDREWRMSRRVRVWIGSFVMVAIFVYFAVEAARSAPKTGMQPFLVPLIVFPAAAIASLDFEFGSRIAAPGRLSCSSMRGQAEFTRTDSVILIEPIGTSDWLAVHVIRRDGRSIRFRFRAGADNPEFRKLISRWCWRDGRGADHAAMPMRDLEPCPVIPNKTPK